MDTSPLLGRGAFAWFGDTCAGLRAAAGTRWRAGTPPAWATAPSACAATVEGLQALLLTDTKHANAILFSNARISFQKHEDESEAWLHRQVTPPRLSPHALRPRQPPDAPARWLPRFSEPHGAAQLPAPGGGGRLSPCCPCSPWPRAPPEKHRARGDSRDIFRGEISGLS